ncbi:hypothetical protein [Luteolibacter sp. LG18]|uniref:hypothetical protein n=1 Tax=Luteolibacter sp. LG18 TaxID=2819286 RepID=UPI002B30DD56|nr:hypothetical protein llg_30670 [Luteolibacter sp. LG18]
MTQPLSQPPQEPVSQRSATPSIWKKMGGGSLSISIIVHAILLLIGVVWIFQIIPEKKQDVDFMPSGGGGGSPGVKDVSNRKQRATIAMPNAPRLAAKGTASTFTLPEPDAASSMSSVGTLTSGGLSGGLGGSGSGGGRGDGQGTGFGNGMGPGLGGGAGKFNPFGMLPDPKKAGLTGTFYDFKRDKDGKPTGVKALDAATAAKIVKEFTKGRSWREPRTIPHYTSPVRLSTRAAFFPGVPDTEAGKAFKAPDTAPGLWIAHYTANVTPSQSGMFRFVGWGDNCLVVGVNGNVRLDASDHGYTGEKRESLGSANLKGKPGAAVFAGDWFQIRAGQTVTVDILIGDEGGIFAAGVLLQAKDQDLTKGASGLPNLPIFRTSDFSAEEQNFFKDQWPAAALQGPVFEVKGGTAIGGI